MFIVPEPVVLETNKLWDNINVGLKVQARTHEKQKQPSYGHAIRKMEGYVAVVLQQLEKPTWKQDNGSDKGNSAASQVPSKRILHDVTKTRRKA